MSAVVPSSLQLQSSDHPYMSHYQSAGTVNSLWPDVPPFEGATKADLAIPLGASGAWQK